MRLNIKRLSGKQIVIGIVGLLILVAASYFLVVRPIRIRLEKIQFEATAKQLEKLQLQIEATIGKPDQIKEVKSCGYASVAYGRGRRSCGTTIYMLFEKKNYTTSSDDVSKLESIPVVSAFRMLGKPQNKFENYSSYPKGNSTPLDQHLDADLYLGKHGRCGVSTSYPVIDDAFSIFNTTSKENLLVSIGCFDEAVAEHYPVQR